MVEDLNPKKDERGTFVEVFKDPDFGQISYSVSRPRVVRGNHYHKRKIEKFLVLQGEGKMRMRNRLSGEAKEFDLSGEAPKIVEIPSDWVHNIENKGENDMIMLVWANEVFKPDDADTFPEEV